MSVVSPDRLPTMTKNICVGASFIVALVVASPAIAGLFTTPLSADDAAQIKHLAVVSALGDTLHGRQIGLTAIGNKAFDALIPEWGLDSRSAAYLQEKIVASGKINGDVESVVASTSEQKAILAVARAGGFDTIAALLPYQNPHDQLLAPGPGLLRRKLPGVDKLYACNSMVMRIFRVADGKQIGYAFVDPCTKQPVAGSWHDNWNDLTEEEKSAMLEQVRSFVEQQILIALRDVQVDVP